MAGKAKNAAEPKPTIGGNLTELKEFIKAQVDAIKELKAEGATFNEDIKSIFAKMESRGISKHAARAAMQYMSWDKDQRRGFDLAYQLVREAMGLPVQADLFDDLEPEGGKDAA